jgi:hypothetical protein
MKEKIAGTIMVLFAVFCFQSLCLAADEVGAAPNWILKTADAKVTAIDVNASTITLKGKNIEVTCAVDKAVANLGELKVGDKVKAEYYISASSDAKKATSEDKKNPLVKLDDTSALPPKASPGSTIKMFKAVVTIISYDPTNGILIVKGPKGKKLTLSSSAAKKDLESGTTVVVKYTEPYVISIKKI